MQGKGVVWEWPCGAAEPKEGDKGTPLVGRSNNKYQSLRSLKRVPLPTGRGKSRNLRSGTGVKQRTD